MVGIMGDRLFKDSDSSRLEGEQEKGWLRRAKQWNTGPSAREGRIFETRGERERRGTFSHLIYGREPGQKHVITKLTAEQRKRVPVAFMAGTGGAGPGEGMARWD